MLLFSTSFVISVLFGDVKTEKIGLFGVTGRYNIAKFSEHKNLPGFLLKGVRSSAFLNGGRSGKSVGLIQGWFVEMETTGMVGGPVEL